MREKKVAPMTFTPDADFPVINLEKGRLQKDFTVKLDAGSTGAAVVKVQGGTKVNVVPDTAVAVVRGLTKDESRMCSRKDKESYYLSAEGDIRRN